MIPRTDASAVATRLEETASPEEKYTLIRMLSSVPMEQATVFAFDLTIAKPGKPLSRLALGGLENVKVGRDLTAGERQKLLDLIRSDEDHCAAQWAKILGRAGAANAEVIQATAKAFVVAAHEN